MAFGAGDILMPAGEQKLRTGVGKFCSGFPAGKIMTTLTGRDKLPAMLVAVATEAVLRQAEKSFCHAHIGVFGKFFLNILGLMAIPAGGLSVFAFQNVTGLPMVKVSLTSLPNDQCKIQSMMIAVTGSARLGLVFRHNRRMKTAPLLQTLRNRNMAFQAFGVARPLAGFMTGQAFGDAFELCVRARQRSR